MEISTQGWTLGEGLLANLFENTLLGIRPSNIEITDAPQQPGNLTMDRQHSLGHI